MPTGGYILYGGASTRPATCRRIAARVRRQAFGRWAVLAGD